MALHVSAVQHLRRMRGGSQAHLLVASNGGYYVTKFQDNPQHVRVLANEMLATRLGQLLGLPMPDVTAIEVSDRLIERTSELSIPGGVVRALKGGMQFASKYVQDPTKGIVYDYLPEPMLERVSNIGDFARVLVLDKWTSNADGRQAVFSRTSGRRDSYFATFIDQGYCFNAGDWSFPDSPLRGVYARNYVYKDVKGWDAFEPVLTRAEELDVNSIWRSTRDIAPEWYENDSTGLNRLIEALAVRRSAIRNLITAFRKSSRDPFPLWTST